MAEPIAKINFKNAAKGSAKVKHHYIRRELRFFNIYISIPRTKSGDILLTAARLKYFK